MMRATALERFVGAIMAGVAGGQAVDEGNALLLIAAVIAFAASLPWELYWR